MEVIIDGTKYVPMSDVSTDKSLLSALEIRFDSDAGENLTIRDYFFQLLKTLWDEKEGFGGKRPFGNSSWEYDLYRPLIERGFIEGKLDEYGCILTVDKVVASKYVHKLIVAAFYGIDG